jgi:hypothetical protein
LDTSRANGVTAVTTVDTSAISAGHSGPAHQQHDAHGQRDPAAGQEPRQPAPPEQRQHLADPGPQPQHPGRDLAHLVDRRVGNVQQLADPPEVVVGQVERERLPLVLRGDHHPLQPGRGQLREQRLLLAAQLRQLIGPPLQVVLRPAGGQVVEDVRGEARPQVRLGVVPRVERDLPDARAVRRHLPPVLLPGLLLSGGRVRERAHPLAHLPHEEALARPPVPEQPDRQRRLDQPRANEIGQHVHIGRDPELIDSGVGVRGVSGHMPRLQMDHRVR